MPKPFSYTTLLSITCFILLAPRVGATSQTVDQKALRKAVKKNDLVNVQQLLHKDPKPTSQFLNTYKLLHRACINGSLPIAQALIQAGANVHSRNMFGNTPLHFAARHGHLDIVHLLLRHGAHPDSPNGVLQQTPLHHAVEKGHAHVVACLVEHNAHLNAQDAFQNTPLHRAVEQTNYDIAAYLLQHGAHKNIPNAFEQTPLHIAQDKPHPNLIKLLQNATQPPHHTSLQTPHKTYTSLAPPPPNNPHTTLSKLSFLANIGLVVYVVHLHTQQHPPRTPRKRRTHVESRQAKPANSLDTPKSS